MYVYIYTYKSLNATEFASQSMVFQLWFPKNGSEDVCCIYITSRCALPILPNKLKIKYAIKFHRSIEQLVPKIDEIDG